MPNQPKADVIVSRYPSLRDILVEDGYANPDTPIVANLHDHFGIEGKVVAGCPTLADAARCDSVYYVDLDIPYDVEISELGSQELRKYLKDIKHLRVTAVS